MEDKVRDMAEEFLNSIHEIVEEIKKTNISLNKLILQSEQDRRDSLPIEYYHPRFSLSCSNCDGSGIFIDYDGVVKECDCKIKK